MFKFFKSLFDLLFTNTKALNNLSDVAYTKSEIYKQEAVSELLSEYKADKVKANNEILNQLKNQ